MYAFLGVSLSMDGNGHVLVHSMPSAFCEKDLSGKRKGRSTVAIDLVQELVTRQLDVRVYVPDRHAVN